MSFLQNNSLLAISPPEVMDIRSLASLGSKANKLEQREEIIEYSVKPGDTISSLSQKFNISPSTIYWANNLNPHSLLKTGQKLIILPVSGIIYHVRKGDTLSKIAQNYKADIQKIIDYNDLSEDGKIYPSDVLIIPGAKIPPHNSPSFKYTFSNISLPKNYFICPVPLTNGKCLVTQNLHYFNAVDLSTPGISCGKPIFAAAQGKVIQTKYGYNHCYGNFIKILHPDGLVTLYAHLQTILVKVGQSVYRGQIIGYIGHTGHTIPNGPAGCHLHFELRSTKGNPPRNPFAY